MEVDSAEVLLPSSLSYTVETWEQINFGSAFSNPPIVITTPGPSSGGQPFTIRIRNVTTTGFEAMTAEPEGNSGPTHLEVEMNSRQNKLGIGSGNGTWQLSIDWLMKSNLRLSFNYLID